MSRLKILTLLLLAMLLSGCERNKNVVVFPTPTLSLEVLIAEPTSLPTLTPTEAVVTMPTPTATEVVIKTLTPTVMPSSGAVLIPAGVAILGRTPDEVMNDYRLCLDMAHATQQFVGMCEPMEDVFGDVPSMTKNMEAFRIEIYEAHDANRLPMQVTYEVAVDLCRQRDGWLPTAEELEYAARGTGGRIWPWGNEFLINTANVDDYGGNPDRQPMQVGSFSQGATPEGVHDLVGNVMEWAEGRNRKGGGAGTFYVFAKPSHILYGGQYAGFRCVYAS